jgi:manganese/iron transport system permease protein
VGVALVGGVCAFLSAYLMLKGWSLIGDALSHSIVPGVAGAYMLGLPFAFGAFLAGGLAAGDAVPAKSAPASRKTRSSADLHLLLRPRPVHGLALADIGGHPDHRAGQHSGDHAGGHAATGDHRFVSLVMLLAKWKDLMVTFFDETHARSIGLHRRC